MGALDVRGNTNSFANISYNFRVSWRMSHFFFANIFVAGEFRIFFANIFAVDGARGGGRGFKKLSVWECTDQWLIYGGIKTKPNHPLQPLTLVLILASIHLSSSLTVGGGGGGGGGGRIAVLVAAILLHTVS